MNRFRSLAASFLALAPAVAAQGKPDLLWLGGGHDDIRGAAITPDEQTLVTCGFSDETVKLWDVPSGMLRNTLNASIGGVTAIALSPDGTTVLSGSDVAFGSGDPLIKRWRVSDGALIQTYDTGEFHAIESLAFSSDGTRFAAAMSDHATVFDVASGAALATFTGHSFTVFSVAFSPNGQMLATASGDDTVKLWNAATGALLHTLTGHTFFVDAVAFSPDSSIVASGSWDNTVRLWNAATGASMGTLTGHTDLVRSVAFSPDGASLVSASWDKTLKIWAIPSGTLQKTITGGKFGSCETAKFFAGGTKIVEGDLADAQARLIDVASGTTTKQFIHHHLSIRAVGFSHDGSKFASAGGDTLAKVWQVSDGADLVTFTQHFDVINAIAFSGDDQRIVTAAGSPGPDTKDPTLRVWNAATGQQLLVINAHPTGVSAGDFAPDGATVASGGFDGRVKLWNSTTGALIFNVNNVASVTEVAYSPDGQTLASAGDDGRIRLWSVATGTLVKTIQNAGAQIISIDWSRDGTRIAAALSQYGDNVKIADVAAGAFVQTLPGDPDGFLQSIAFSADGEQVAVGSGYSRRIQIWSLHDSTQLASYDEEVGFGLFVQMPVAFSPDGTRLGFGRTDATVAMAQAPVPAIHSYGIGSPGSGGIVPRLELHGAAAPGHVVDFAVSQGLGGASAFVIFGTGAAEIPVGTVDLLVFPVFDFFLGTTLSPGGPGSGAATIPLGIPDFGVPVPIFTQALVLDAGAPGIALSASNGITFTIP